MFPGVLIVEHPCSSLYRDWPTVLSRPEVPVSRQFWNSFVPERLCSGEQSLLIANAVPRSEEAIRFFHRLREEPLSMPTFAILPENDGELLQAAADIVDDFLVWPVRPEELRKRINRLLGPQKQSLEDLKASLAGEMGLKQFVGQDPAFLKLLTQVTMFSASDAPVLLTGETGTGKELCARIVHLLSRRHNGPFIPVDCGAVPDHLFENEFFGHSRGAFTDARADQKGLVTLAQDGTLFMDEIDGLSLATQGKVLRLLQEHTYRPLGSENFKYANLRIIAATNRDLERLVKNKEFRADLFFRINVLRGKLPALRERNSDISVLGRHFVDEICKTNSIAKKVLSLAAVRKLETYSWPGNVRELYNTIQRAVLYSPGPQIAAASIDLVSSSDEPDQSDDFRSAKLHAIRRFEQGYVQRMMEKHAGNVTRAAREAGKDRRAFGRLVKKYGVERGAA